MKKAPSTYSAMVILAVFLCLFETTHAQCSFCIDAHDANCSGSYFNCVTGSTTGCVSTATFSPPCTGQYKLAADVVNCADCTQCLSCALIVEQIGQQVVASVHSRCTEDICSNSVSVNLNSGLSYKLYVCLRPCDNRECGTDCKSGRTARGWIENNVTACP